MLEQRRADPEPLSQDTIFSVLQNARRRYVIYYLVTHDGWVTSRDLADQVAAWENDDPVQELSYEQRKRVRTALYQTHLPRLDDAGVIEYDVRDGRLRPTDQLTAYERYLDRVPEPTADDRSSRYVAAAFAATAGLTVLLGLLDVGGLVAVPGFAYGAVGLLGLGALATIHVYTSRYGTHWRPDDIDEPS